jgi:hypothetical protein
MSAQRASTESSKSNEVASWQGVPGARSQRLPNQSQHDLETPGPEVAKMADATCWCIQPCPRREPYTSAGVQRTLGGFDRPGAPQG